MTIHFCTTNFQKAEMWKLATEKPSPEIPNDAWICRNGNKFAVLDNTDGTLYLAEFWTFLDAMRFAMCNSDFSSPKDCVDTEPWQIEEFLP